MAVNVEAGQRTAGKEPLTFFQRAQSDSRKGAEQAKQLLAARLAR